MEGKIERIYTMKATPLGEPGINLKEEIWKIEDRLDMVYSEVDKNYSTIASPYEPKAKLKLDGTLLFICSKKEECRELLEKMRRKISDSGLFMPTFRYSDLIFEKYAVKRRVMGTLEKIVPKDFSVFTNKNDTTYKPRQVAFEFADSKNKDNFIRISFNEQYSEERPILNVMVESNNEGHADETMETIVKFCERGE